MFLVRIYIRNISGSKKNPVLLIETIRLAVKIFGKSKISTLNRKPVQLIRPVLLIEQYL